MSNAAKVGGVGGVLALAAGLGLLIGWIVSRQGEAPPIAVPPGDNPPLAAAAQPQLAGAQAQSTTPAQDMSGPAEPAPAPVYSTDWEQRLDDILLSTDEVNAKADHILELIPTAPPDAQVELTQHLVNMVQDDHYDGAAGLLTNAATPAAVSTVLMNDLLNRNNGLKLPMLLAVARDSDHPLKDQAHDMLELLTQQDNGTNWDQWQTSIDTWLQNNPP
jgi:hypothetical protein